MPKPTIDPSTLTSFQHAAAGHEGPLSDPAGTLFIKPCTQTEIDFYEAANASYPGLSTFMPTYMGTLSLEQQQVTAVPIIEAATATSASKAAVDNITALAVSSQSGQNSSAPTSTVIGALKGKKLNTDVHIVLQNAAASFTRANVLDLKLGARLWDDDSAPEKRARLDAVSNATTSGSLGFRIAGMRTYQGSLGRPGKGATEAAKLGYGELEAKTNMFSFNKLFGRQFKGKEVISGFRHFVHVPEAGVDKNHALGLVNALIEGTNQLLAILETTELRMYSASILYVFEGDGETFDRKHEAATSIASQLEEASNVDQTDSKLAQGHENEDEVAEDHAEVDDEDEDDDADPNALLSIKLIDFAHAHFVPGQGPDENILRGVRSIVEILKTLLQELT